MGNNRRKDHDSKAAENRSAAGERLPIEGYITQQLLMILAWNSFQGVFKFCKKKIGIMAVS
ncbi:hypothetical protein PsorP6_005780 [Peronosclerospora sorghi]|uniref:Uncharacterized protein n=1 Tax=Peronosclerospora sorghi TaxID=230839 RepID=A0ACC0W274_9STRA|nr:hypothetical protein PsorP6_005780 [Peronosclerospora sorghi]